jgi:hypothetical protein
MNNEILYDQFKLSVINLYNLYINIYNNHLEGKVLQKKDHEYLVKAYLEKDYEQVLTVFEDRVDAIENYDLKEAISVSGKRYHDYDVENIKKAIKKISTDDINIIKSVLRAVVEGPFFPDWEFHTLFGLNRNDVRKIMEEWPRLEDENENISLAINNAFNNLLFYPHRKDDSINDYIQISKKALKKKYNEWKELTTFNNNREGNSSSEYFKNIR